MEPRIKNAGSKETLSRIQSKARAAKAAARILSGLPRAIRSDALRAIDIRLNQQAERIFEANRRDILAAEEAGLSAVLIKRLLFGKEKLEETSRMLSALRKMEDPLDKILEARSLDTNLILRKVTCPIGVLAFIFESRPDALIQMAGLSVRSGNSILLKGGKESTHTNRELIESIGKTGEEAGLPVGWLAGMESHEDVHCLLGLDSMIDLIIPRGSREFVETVKNSTRIPVLGHADGVCHVYIHEDANLEKAIRITVDSKTQYPAACNAAEVLLIHRSAAPVILPELVRELERCGVFLELCPESFALLGPSPNRSIKQDAQWSVEFLELRMAIRIVGSLEEAADHINQYGSGHTDCIVTESPGAGHAFIGFVDSSSVFVNVSTRFADGYRYGLGAEIGISTGKLHARGPMGVEGILTYKWILEGNGNTVDEYSRGIRSFRHADLPNYVGERYGAG